MNSDNLKFVFEVLTTAHGLYEVKINAIDNGGNIIKTFKETINTVNSTSATAKLVNDIKSGYGPKQQNSGK